VASTLMLSDSVHASIPSQVYKVNKNSNGFTIRHASIVYYYVSVIQTRPRLPGSIQCGFHIYGTPVGQSRDVWRCAYHSYL